MTAAVTQQTRRALGSQALLTLVGGDSSAIARTFDELWHTIDTFEARFSRFQATSELTHVNAQAGTPTAVSPEFVALLEQALAYAERTNGLFNPLILPSLQRAGYVGSWPHPAQFDAKLDWSGRRQAATSEVDLTATTVLLPPDSALDFGGIGKGYLLDQLAAQAEGEPAVESAWLSLGGDICALGVDPATGRPWVVAVDPARPGEPAPEPVAAINGRLNVATSGVTRRAGQTGGRAWHHLIDPRTGRPADTDVLTATVAATTATDADILASCAVILGSQAAPSWLAEQGATNVRLQTRTKGSFSS